MAEKRGVLLLQLLLSLQEPAVQCQYRHAGRRGAECHLHSIVQLPLYIGSGRWCRLDHACMLGVEGLSATCPVCACLWMQG